MRIGIVFLFIGMLTISCSTKKKVADSKVAEDALSYKYLLSDLDKQYPDYSSMASDIRLHAHIDGSSYRVNGLIRHVRDKGVFILVRKLGFEIGRVLITKDSFFVLNRWEKEYIKEPISVLEQEYEVKGDFNLVEELLTGIPQVSSYKKNHKTTIEGGTHRVEVPSVYNDIELIMWIEEGSNHIRQAYYEDISDRGILMTYQSARKNKVVIERELRTENIEDNEIHIKLAYKNPKFNSTSLPTFTIPSHYSRRLM